MILNIAIVAFVVLELSNVMILYFRPAFGYGNSMAAFTGWSESANDERRRLFADYMVKWVANCKLIFILLLVVLLFAGDETIKVYSVGATIVSIGVYFVTLHPIIRKLDKMGEITPKGYSRTLGLTIGGFMAMFSVALVLHFVFAWARPDSGRRRSPSVCILGPAGLHRGTAAGTEVGIALP